MVSVFGLLLLVAVATGNIYLHNPRGSNNRLNEKTAARSNANRLFNSQNNDRGGYNVGDTAEKTHGDSEQTQYRMKYFQSGPKYKVLDEGQGRSHMTLEWTNQHGCGSGNKRQNCNIVFQYMCEETVESDKGTPSDENMLRNGDTVRTAKYVPRTRPGETEAEMSTRRTQSVRTDSAQHESWQSYDNCVTRRRNEGLFTADQTLAVDKMSGYSGATHTRQSPDGERWGYECPEERDYFPYWHPAPWRDIAVLAETDAVCGHYQKSSFNVRPYHECMEFWDVSRTRRKPYSSWNNKRDCETHGGTWEQLYSYLEKSPVYASQTACESASRDGVHYIWAVPYDTSDGSRQCLVRLDEPTCRSAPWSRSNHLGNGRFGAANNLTWVLPYFPSGKSQACVLRVRYNVTSEDYDPSRTDHRYNNEKSPVTDDPYVDVDAGGSTLKLAVDTAHFGRVFQDRTHVFILRPRPPSVGEKARIYNLNVRGKRGNIVQAFPAVEYDFFPRRLSLRPDDLVHVQWTGSNSHHNGGPRGDGQTGADGEGKAGTDRNNLVQISDLNKNFPMPFENTTMWSNVEVVWIYHGKTELTSRDLALNMASSGYFVCLKKSDCSESAEDSLPLNTKLDNTSPSYEGALLRFKKGRYHFMCTRNNNYTNRSQKGTIIVH
ncbi:hypothetical protein NP493_1112g00003 [Ridgeia piscesae]|uniref:Protein DD3-3 n=1 Tax=Ridgeia piscesae TaxID=27915 RepID=A0AAD9KGY5_RIDPI|nr:hypothetical protein NP493_1112g00003 [Ridgeia piscesae]